MTETITDLASTIVPVHNRAALLNEAIESVLAQTWRPIEIIVVDDGSTDDTGGVADDWQTRHPDTVRTLHIANGGPGAAREAGRQAASGEFIQYLDSDDLLMADKFALQIAALRNKPEADVAYGRARYRHADGRVDDPLKKTEQVFKTMFPSFLMMRWWTTSCPLYRRRVTDAAGPWLATWNEEDWEYDCRIASIGGRLVRVSDLVCEQRDHGDARLSRDGLDPARLQDRALAHRLMFGHARSAGIKVVTPEVRHFARELFLLSRQCGAAGLGDEAQMLFHLAKQASEPSRAAGLDFRLYENIAGLIGWATAGRLAVGLDRLRP